MRDVMLRCSIPSMRQVIILLLVYVLSLQTVSAQQAEPTALLTPHMQISEVDPVLLNWARNAPQLKARRKLPGAKSPEDPADKALVAAKRKERMIKVAHGVGKATKLALFAAGTLAGAAAGAASAAAASTPTYTPIPRPTDPPTARIRRQCTRLRHFRTSGRTLTASTVQVLAW